MFDSWWDYTNPLIIRGFVVSGDGTGDGFMTRKKYVKDELIDINGQDSIRDFIAFPKNNSGRDVMLDTPAPIAD